jgi:hypothetical protein
MILLILIRSFITHVPAGNTIKPEKFVVVLSKLIQNSSNEKCGAPKWYHSITI